jgi:hypothetical protein
MGSAGRDNIGREEERDFHFKIVYFSNYYMTNCGVRVDERVPK